MGRSTNLNDMRKNNPGCDRCNGQGLPIENCPNCFPYQINTTPYNQITNLNDVPEWEEKFIKEFCEEIDDHVYWNGFKTDNYDRTVTPRAIIDWFRDEIISARCESYEKGFSDASPCSCQKGHTRECILSDKE